MTVPTEELKLEIVHAVTGKTLGARVAPSADGTLVVRDVPAGGTGPQRWQLVPVPAAPQGGPVHGDGHAYAIRDAAGGQVLDNPSAADRGVRQGVAAAGKKSQRWHVVPVDGEAGLYFIETAADGTVLDLDEPGADDTRIVLRPYDEDAASQRWRFVPAAPERTSDLALRWESLSHWNGRQSWRLDRSAALRPVPGAAPSFSDMLLVLEQFGSDSGAGEWKSDGAAPPPGGQPERWAGAGARFLADTTGAGRADIVALRPAKGAVASATGGDGTFGAERVLHPPVPSPSPSDLWTLADTTGSGKPDAVVLAADGVRVFPQAGGGTFAAGSGKPVVKAFGHGAPGGGWRADRHPCLLADTTGDGRLDVAGFHDDGLRVSLQDEAGAFAPVPDEPVLRAFGYGERAGGWRVEKHPRFLADTTGDGRLDVIGCHGDGVWVSLQDEAGVFADPLHLLAEFGVAQGWRSVAEHPRFLAPATGGGTPDLVGFGPQGVVVAKGRGDGTFEPARIVLNDFGSAQGWTSTKHLRFLTDVTGDGRPDIVGFGDEGVWVSHGRGDGRFEQAQLVCRGFGYNEDAGAWRVGRHPRFLADITGEGRVDIVGFGGPGVYVARNLYRRFRTTR